MRVKMKANKTIRITEEVKKILRDAKSHERETFDMVIRKLACRRKK